MLTTDQRKTLIHVSGMDIELERRGRGQPLLLLYGEEGLEPEAPFLDELAKALRHPLYTEARSHREQSKGRAAAARSGTGPAPTL